MQSHVSVVFIYGNLINITITLSHYFHKKYDGQGGSQSSFNFSQSSFNFVSRHQFSHRSQVTGHCFTNTESILNIHKS